MSRRRLTPKEQETKDAIARWMTMGIIGIMFYGCVAPKKQYPHPPGGVLHWIEFDCVVEHSDPPAQEGCIYQKSQEWLRTHPKEEWVWY